jgi:hypothetical protein
MQYYPGEKYGETRIINGIIKGEIDEEGEIEETYVVYRMTDIVDDNNNTISYRYTLLDENDNFEPFGDEHDEMSFRSNNNYITLLNFRVMQQQTGGRKRKRKTHKKRKSSRRRKSIRRIKSRRRK